MVYSFFSSPALSTFASDTEKNIMESSLHRERRKDMPDWIFVLWAGGTALLSYSLVYALRKPFTAAEFEGLQVGGMDYKIAVSIIQLLGYVTAKLLGIKYISELKPEGRLKFIIGSAALSEIALLAFGLLPLPYNIAALFSTDFRWGACGELFSVFLKEDASPTSWRVSWG